MPILGILSYLTFLFVLHDFDPDFFEIDRCFDMSGCWDAKDRVCRKEEPNAQALCNRVKGTDANESYQNLVDGIKKVGK